MVAPEEHILKSRQIFEQLAHRVLAARQDSASLHEVERDLWHQGRQALLELLRAYVASKGDGDCGDTVSTHDGTRLPRANLHTRPYRSVFGDLAIERMCYGRGKIEAAPLDAALGLPEHCYSYVLQQWTQDLAVDIPFQKCIDKLAEVLEIGQPLRSVERMSRHVAQSVESFRQQAPALDPDTESSIVVATADAASLPLCRDKAEGEASTREPGHRRPVGQNAHKRKHAVCSAVYTVAPFVRSVDDVMNEILRDACQADRPRPQSKRVRGDLLGGKPAAFEWLADETQARKAPARHARSEPRPVVAVFDGEQALWDHARTSLRVDDDPNTTGVLDIFHVMDRLWDVAYVFHAQGSPEAHAFVQTRLRMVLEGRVGRMIGGLRQMATKRGWTLGKRKPGRRKQGEPAPARESPRVKGLRCAIEYFHTYRRYMRYDAYLKAGYPIGSGVAEGTCRHLVKDRMDGTGMRWTPVGAQSMLDLRAMHISQQWRQFWTHHVERETDRLYKHLCLPATSEGRAA